jgi:hypothetical protein
MPAVSEYRKISDKAVKVIGVEAILAMSPPQRGLLNNALDRLVVKRGSAENVTDDEILGQYEQIVDYALPTGTHEHLLQQLSARGS